MTEQELLAVLDMSEDEQFKWLMYNDIVTNEYVKCSRHLILADLAFRLRNEAKYEAWTDALATVSGYVQDKIAQAWNSEKEDLDVFDWKYNAKPIHWIIAALIAKGKR